MRCIVMFILLGMLICCKSKAPMVDKLYSEVKVLPYPKSNPILVKAVDDLSDCLTKYIRAEKEIIIVLTKDDNIPSYTYHIKSGSNQINITGSTEIALINGIYSYIYKDLKVVYTLPNEEPTYLGIRKESLPVVDYTSTPDFFVKHISGDIFRKNDGKNWLHRSGLNIEPIRFHHNMKNLVSPAKYVRSNPEFYPISDKTALKTNLESHNWQPDFNNEGVYNAAVQEIEREIEGNNDLGWVSLGINDSQLWHKGSKSLSGNNVLGYKNHSNTYYKWTNRIAKRFEDSNLTFGLLAYHSTLAPPNFPIHKSILPFLTYERYRWLDHRFKSIDLDLTKAWLEKAERFGWYDYAYGKQYKIPRIYTTHQQKYLKEANALGVKYYYAETYPHADAFEGYKYFVLSKLLNDVDSDIERLKLDWCKAYIGDSAATDLKAYYDFWEYYWINKVPQLSWFQQMNKKVEYLAFFNDGYMNALDIHDIDYLDEVVRNIRRQVEESHYEKFKSFEKRWHATKREILMHLKMTESVISSRSRQSTSSLITFGRNFKKWKRSNTSATYDLTDGELTVHTSSLDGQESLSTYSEKIPLADDIMIAVDVLAESPNVEGGIIVRYLDDSDKIRGPKIFKGTTGLQDKWETIYLKINPVKYAESIYIMLYTSTSSKESQRIKFRNLRYVESISN